MKKYLHCPICGSLGEDMIFAFYCGNEKCQNFRVIEGEEPIKLKHHTLNNEENDDDDDVYSVYGFWPYGD